MSAIDDLAKSLEGAIGKNDKAQEVSNWLDTGYPPLNEILGGNGLTTGIPFGRIIEMFGPPSAGKTAIATLLMIEAQRSGGVAMFMDHENTFDVGMAIEMGLNTEFPYWIYKRPDTWEESNTMAMKAAEAIRLSKAIAPEAPIFVVFDSVASMIPKSVFEKGIDEYTMNDTTALARVTSSTLKAVNQFTSKQNATMLYLNQIRTKLGIVFGDPTCLRGDVMIPFVDGSSATIKEIVDSKISKQVWSINEETGQLEPKNIIGWHDNGALPADQNWVNLTVDAVQTKNGTIGLSVTKDHRLLTSNGWKLAENITVSDKLITKVTDSIGGSALSFLHAVIAGDSSISIPMGANRKTASLIIQDNNDPDYAAWKVSKLDKFLNFKKTVIKISTNKDGFKYVSEFSHQLYKMAEHKRDPLYSFDDLTPMKLALWVMDDGYLDSDRVRYTISLKRKKNLDYMDELADMLFEKHGLRARVRAREGSLIFDKESSLRIANFIAEFVPECMQRKLPQEFRGKFVDFDLWTEGNITTKEVDIRRISVGSVHRKLGRYDVTVEDNHNYLVGNKDNGIIVHNCTPGGSAFEFFASIRLSLGRTRVMEDEDGKKKMVGQIINVKTVKNKVTRPFQEVKLTMMFNESGGIEFDTVATMVDYLLDNNLLSYSKPYITWTDGKKYHKKPFIKHIKDTNAKAELFALYKK